MLEIQRRGASAAKLRGKEWMQIEWRFEQPSFQSVDETKDNEIQKIKVQMELSYIHTDVRLAAATCWIKLWQLMLKSNGDGKAKSKEWKCKWNLITSA